MHLDDKVLFVHNPRTSGTSIRRALLLGAEPNRAQQFPACLPDMGKHAFPHQIRKKLEASQTCPPGIWESLFKFSVVRNPWDRMVSLYGLFRRFGQSDFKERSKKAKIPIKLRKFIGQLEHPSIHPLMGKAPMTRIVLDALDLGFKDWLKFCDNYSWQGCSYLGHRPMTRIPQCEWFGGLDKVFRFEEREEINAFLEDNGYSACEMENATERRNWESYYDCETFDLVADIFREDIKRFGY